jgi:hypothetical protein
MFDYASWACGAALTGAELILSGETDIAFNPSLASAGSCFRALNGRMVLEAAFYR